VSTYSQLKVLPDYHLLKTNFCVKIGFRDNKELKVSKSLRHTHIAQKFINITFLLLSSEQALIVYFIITWKYRELKNTVAEDFQPTMNFLEMDINYSYQQFKIE
jgi:hypothetical protein